MFKNIKYKIQEIKGQKEAEIVRKKVDNYYNQMRRTINYDLKMSKQFEDNIWLWDTNRFVDQFAQEIADHNLSVHMIEGGMAEYIMFIKWLSVRLKMINDDTITKLIQEYVKYGIKHYDTVLFGREIIKFRDLPVYPVMIYNAYIRNKYGRFNWFDKYDENAEFLELYNPYYSPSIDIKLPGIPEIEIIDNGNDIIFKKEEKPADDAPREEIEKWLKESWEKFKKELDEDMPEEILKEEEEIMRRFREDNDTNN